MSNLLQGFNADGIRELTAEERMTWGTCKICGAVPGEFCFADIGIHLGSRADGSRPQDGDGTHYARLQAAPFHVRLSAV